MVSQRVRHDRVTSTSHTAQATVQGPSSTLSVMPATAGIRQSGAGHSQPVQWSQILRALVGDFRSGECQIGLSRLRDSGLPSLPAPTVFCSGS